jgi:hypothetical protein
MRCRGSQYEPFRPAGSVVAGAGAVVAGAHDVADAARGVAGVVMSGATAAIWPSLDHPLHGVRLGRMERYLLSRAPTPEALHGYVIDDADRSIREQLRRAAVTLEGKGLVERLPLGVYVRARDTRREGLRFHKGRFWVHADPTRAHAVRRNVVWKSPFGFEIYLLYRDQLDAGMPIRWDAGRVLRAERRAASKAMDRQFYFRAAIESREEEARDAVFADSTGRMKEVVPVEVRSRHDRARWGLAVVVAQQRAREEDAGGLWDLALRIYGSETTSSLRAEAAGTRSSTRAEQFRRQRKSALQSSW